MTKLIDIVIPNHVETIEPELYASIFDTEEAHLLQQRVAQVHALIDGVLRGSGIEIVKDTYSQPQVPGAFAVNFQAPVPEDIHRVFDAPYKHGAMHDGLVTGKIRIPLDAAGDFYVDYFGRRSMVGMERSFRQRIPSSPETNWIPKIQMDARNARLGLLGVAAAAVFAESWNVPNVLTQNAISLT